MYGQSFGSDDEAIQNVCSWVKISINNIPHALRFLAFGDPKVIVNVNEDDRLLAFFILSEDKSLQYLIVNETINKFTNKFGSKNPCGNAMKLKVLSPTNVDKIMLFFSLIILARDSKKARLPLVLVRHSEHTPVFFKVLTFTY